MRERVHLAGGEIYRRQTAAPTSGVLVPARPVRNFVKPQVKVLVQTGRTEQRCAKVSTRVLIVDDFRPFLILVRSLLEEMPDLRIVGEATDGLEAVQKAVELKPDLILLDIGLPTLNGIEAARQIRKLAPESKIIFLSQESSADVVQEALSVGAWGYVVKAKAGSELLAAVETVILGKKFVSST